MSATALLLQFNDITEFNDWITAADAMAGLPDTTGTTTLTYPMPHAGKVYCYVTEACPKEALPANIYDTSGLIKGEDGIYDVSLTPLDEAATSAFTTVAKQATILENNE